VRGFALKAQQWRHLFGAAQEWELVKAVFSSLDSAHHQLVSHWLRTHACVEPFIAATERCLSAAHPLYQLLRPHFKHTLRMNANVRTVSLQLLGRLQSLYRLSVHNMPGKARRAYPLAPYLRWLNLCYYP
jgi:hypothetical protein